MTDLKKCLFLTLVSCVFSFPYPISQPVYPNTQLLSAETVPQTPYKLPAAPGYIPQTQYIRQPVAQPVYDTRVREGLQNYATNNQHHATNNQNYATNNQNQAIQQLLVPTAADRQVQKAALPTAQYYLNQIQSAHLAAQAQDAFSASQRKAPTQTVNRPIPVPQHTPLPLPQQYSRDPPPQYSREQTQQYVREQPVQYVREQPQTRYISRPVTAQYRVQQQQQQPQEEQQKEKEDYDHNPSYQFGFDVKDDLYTNYQNRKEQREGNKITGSYSVVDSDGFIRTVSYTADPKEGFKAEVTRQPTDIVVKVPKPNPQFQNASRQQQYVQEVPTRGHVQQEQRQQSNIVYQYQ